jgi:hypothetical protein
MAFIVLIIGGLAGAAAGTPVLAEEGVVAVAPLDVNSEALSTAFVMGERGLADGTYVLR